MEGEKPHRDIQFTSRKQKNQRKPLILGGFEVAGQRQNCPERRNQSWLRNKKPFSRMHKEGKKINLKKKKRKKMTSAKCRRDWAGSCFKHISKVLRDGVRRMRTQRGCGTRSRRQSSFVPELRNSAQWPRPAINITAWWKIKPTE